jgi:hypothetical protein
MPSVFISYNHRDRQFVRRLAEDLRRAGIRAWVDEYEILPGDSITEKTTQGINTSDYMLVVVSKNSVNSSWVSKEVSAAFMRDPESSSRRVIPLKIDDTALPPKLGDILYVDFSTGYVEPMERLVSFLYKKQPDSVAEVSQLVDARDFAKEIHKEFKEYEGSGYSLTTVLGILTLLVAIVSAIPSFITAFADKPKVYYSLSANRIEIPSQMEASKVREILRSNKLADSTLRVDVINSGDAVAKQVEVGVSVPGEVADMSTIPAEGANSVSVKVRTERDAAKSPSGVKFVLQDLVATKSATAFVRYYSDNSNDSPNVEVAFDGKLAPKIQDIRDATPNSYWQIFKLPLLILGVGLLVTFLLGLIKVLRENPRLRRASLLILKELNPTFYRVIELGRRADSDSI